MSEHSVRRFLEAHKKAEIGITAAGAAVAAAYLAIDQGRRKKRVQKQLGYDKVEHERPLEERTALFDSKDGPPDDTTELAAYILYVSKTGADQGVSAAAVKQEFGFDESRLGLLLNSLHANNFITIEPSLSDEKELTLGAAPDLFVAEDLSPALALALSNRLLEAAGGQDFSDSWYNSEESPAPES